MADKDYWNDMLEVEAVHFIDSCNSLVALCGGLAKEAGWDKDPLDVPRSLMLIVSELGEAMEGHRKSLGDDKLPEYFMLHVELADALIRIFHLSMRLGMDGVNTASMGEIMIAKLKFNTVRPDHKLENRAKEGGKAY